MLYNTWLHVVSCLRTVILYMVERKYANGLKRPTQAPNASTKRKHITQALTLLPNASTKRKHTTQALTRRPH